MSKNSKNKPFQTISPENYIRQKARNLPIYECKVNQDWDLNQMANIIVARSHANGNITMCFYLVDLACLGVKDTFYKFNINTEEYVEIMEKFADGMPLKVIPYELAHNIIYAGIEFAEEYGFKPHKDFTSVTRFMLKEDTDDVELIEIEVGGNDGNPMYINSGYESPAREKQILSQLEKMAGAGNFNYILPIDGNNPTNEKEDDDYNRGFEFPEFTLVNMKEEFLALMNENLHKFSADQTSDLIQLSNDIYILICNKTEVYDHIDRWEKELDIEITEEYTNEFFGVDESVKITDKQLHLIDEIISLFVINNKKAAKKLKELERQIGKTSLIAAMELEILKFISIKDFKAKLADYLLIYPDCSFLKMMNHLESFIQNKDADLIQYLPDADFIFKGRSSVTEYEMSRYLTDKLFIISKIEDINLTQAFFLSIDDFALSEDAYKSIKGTADIYRLTVLKSYFEKNG